MRDRLNAVIRAEALQRAEILAYYLQEESPLFSTKFMSTYPQNGSIVSERRSW